MGLISHGGENLLDFLELRQVLSTYDGDLRDPLWWPQERPVPLRIARGPLVGLSGFLSYQCWGLKPSVESVPKPEDSSPGLTWVLGYYWSLPRGVSPRLQWGHASALSSLAVAAVSRFPSRLEGRTSWIFSSCGRCSRLKTGPQGPVLVASGKASPLASCSGASRDSSPVDARA